MGHVVLAAFALVRHVVSAHIRPMWKREQWRRFGNHPVTQWGIFALGVLLMILSPVAGVVPGPGGIFVFAIGLALVLKTSMWAKRRYVHFKRWQPKAGRWADWGLRRASAKRREALRKERSITDAALSGPARTAEVVRGATIRPEKPDRCKPDQR